MLIDAIVIKVRDTQVANRTVYVVIGVNLDGERDVLGGWLGPTGGEGAKQWMGECQVLCALSPGINATQLGKEQCCADWRWAWPGEGRVITVDV